LKAEPSFRATLMAIWERLLDRPHIGIEEDFFKLGGDPSVAVGLFSEIKRTCGRSLPPETIYVAPTIDSLAALLERPVLPQFPPLVLLKEGTQQQPVFITHGLGATISELFHVVNHMRSKNPIYGMQAKGIDGRAEPSRTIEEMAAYFLEAVKKLQPRGPYCFVGYSLGGLVTFEMARQLSASGDCVGLLAMLDSYPHMEFLSSGEKLRLLRRRIRSRLAGTLNPRLRKNIPFTGESIGREVETARRSAEYLNDLSGFASIWPPPRYRESTQSALARYRPRFYSGKMKFVRAAMPSRFPENPAAVWAHLVERIEIQTVPGDHRGMITVHAEALGKILSTYLAEEFPEL
jgi:acetoacetyl-CoA synthetase